VAVACFEDGGYRGPHTTMAVVMEPYSEDGDCPKCGNAGEGTSVEYHAAKSPKCASGEPVEHLHRGCNWCGYEWVEAPPELVP
jgi:hypothetical protein